VIGTQAGLVATGKNGKDRVTIEKAAADAKPESYDALVIPGGHSPENLRTDPTVIAFVNAMVRAGKLVAAVCHGPQLLVAVGAVDGKRLTSWPSVKDELVDAGATWVDRDVVIDGSLITSRKPEDLPAFTHAIEEQLAIRHELPAGAHPQELPGPRR
jgi:protease I